VTAPHSGSSDERLARLGGDAPHWRPWLVVLKEVLRAGADGGWDRAVPAAPEPRSDAAPLLAGATLAVERDAATRWLRRLFGAAADAGGDAAATLGGAARSPGLDPLAVLEAALEQDGARLDAMATTVGAAAPAFRAVADLAAIPLAQACGRRWAVAVDPGWTRGHCPVCGGWPTLAEARGVERTRRFRCARCGGDWATAWLRCAYCDNGDHERLGALVPERGGETRRVEVCHLCRGYLKTLATLRASDAAGLLLDDLATVDLDVAAVAQGYARPARAACVLGVRVVAAGARRWRLPLLR
jgi:FdhE protein